MKRIYWIAFAIAVIILLLIYLIGSSLLGDWNNWGWGMMNVWSIGSMHGWGFGTFGWFGMLLMWLIPAEVAALVIFGIIWLARSLPNRDGDRAIIAQSDNSQCTPREILQKRYVSGEIDREQYLQMVEDVDQ